MEYIDQINHINSLLQELETKIVYMQDNVKKVNSSSSSNTTDITAITEKLNSLTTSINTIQINISNLQSSTTSNTTEISGIKATLSSISSQIDTLNSQIDVITTATNTNSTNISNLQEQVTQNTATISEINESLTQINNSITQINSTLQELQNSGGGGCECEEQLTSISTKINNMETIVNKFTTLIKDRNASIDTSYTQIDPDAVVQTYDCMEKRYNYSGNGTYNSGLFEFCVQEGTTACTLNIITTLTSSAETDVQALLNFYFNGSTTAITKHITIYKSLKTQTTTFELPLTSTGNFFYFTVGNQVSKTTITFDYAKVEVTNCTNPIILNKICPFSVDYFNGKYYLTDCTGEYVKTAEINASDIATISDLTWNTTTIKASAGGTVGMLNRSNSTYTINNVARVYLLYNSRMYCENPITETNVSNANGTYSYFNTYQPVENHFSVTTNMTTTTNIDIRRITFSKSGSTGQTAFTNSNNEIAYYVGFKTLKDTYTKTTDVTFRLYQKMDGTVEIKYNSTIFNLGKGVLQYAYFINDNLTKFHIFVNIYGKLIRYTVEYSSSGFSLLANEYLGDYDLYYEGVDNDYFIVKNNTFSYYKESLQDLTQ